MPQHPGGNFFMTTTCTRLRGNTGLREQLLIHYINYTNWVCANAGKLFCSFENFLDLQLVVVQPECSSTKSISGAVNVRTAEELYEEEAVNKVGTHYTYFHLQ